MFKTLLAKVIGTRHQREQKRVQPIVDEINAIGERLRTLADAELQAQTAAFRATIAEATEALRGRIEALKAEKHAAVDAAAREAIDLQLSGPDGQGGSSASIERRSKGCWTRSSPRPSPPCARRHVASWGPPWW